MCFSGKERVKNEPNVATQRAFSSFRAHVISLIVDASRTGNDI